MTDLRTAAQQALEALEEYQSIGASFMSCDAAVVALRAALEEPVEPKNAWAHLPNARHIDRILAHVKAHPDKWDAALDAARDTTWDAAAGAAWDAAWNAAWDAAWGRVAARGAALDAAWNAAWDAARGAARDAAWDAAWDAARDAILALVAWDEAGKILSLPRSEVRDMADKSDHAAVLIYPAMLAMGEDK